VIFCDVPAPVFWAIVKPWLDPVTQAKIHIVGSDFKAYLDNLIAPEYLPREYGGSCCTCPPVYDLLDSRPDIDSRSSPTLSTASLSSAVNPSSSLSSSDMSGGDQSSNSSSSSTAPAAVAQREQ